MCVRFAHFSLSSTKNKEGKRVEERKKREKTSGQEIAKNNELIAENRISRSYCK